VADGDWMDPFTEDEAARERARRRAERDQRRAERAATHGEAAQRAGERRDALAQRVREQRDGATDGSVAGGPQMGASRGGGQGGSDDGHGPRRAPGAPPPRPPGPRRLQAAARRRRLIALFGVLILAFIGLVAVVLATRGGDEPAPATTAQPKLKTISVTIPEGYDRNQIAATAEDAGLRGDYMKARKRFKGFDPSRYGADHPSDLEGFLFPATYELYKHASVNSLVRKQLAAFKQNIAGVDMGYAKSKNLTVYDVLIIASMIQREVSVGSEMKLVGSVIYNRLSAGMALGIDATIRFEDQNYTQPLTESRLQEDTPYNTRTNVGLPPGPIGNPGLAAIEAAAHPAQTDYLYYVVKPGTCGRHVFVKTQAEFDQAVANYNSAREAAGGKSPTDC
jgi:hypothetical protein